MTTAWVLDASILAAFFLREPEACKLDAVLQDCIAGAAEFHAPSLLPYEMTNILLMAVRRSRISDEQRASILLDWELIPVTLHPAPTPQDRARILSLADRHRLSAHDAAYLELAERIQARLLTLDDALLKLKRSSRWIA